MRSARSVTPSWIAHSPTSARACSDSIISAPSPLSRSSTGNGCAVEEYVGVRLAVGRRHGPNLDPVGVRVDQEDADVTVVDRGGDEHGVGELRGRYQLLGFRRGASRPRRGVRWSQVRSGRSGRVRPNPR